MTQGVSRRFWWTIAILRTFVFITFTDEEQKYDKRVFLDEMRTSIRNDIETDESIIETEENLDGTISANNGFSNQVARDIGADSDAAGLVLKLFAFVDIKNHRLFNLLQFTNILISYPNDSTDKENHSISTWRQGLAALWKHFIIPNINFGVENIISKGFGNSPITFGNAYGVDPSFAEGTDLLFSEMQAACTLFHKAIGAVAVKDVKFEMPIEIFLTTLENYDLIEASKKYFNTKRFDYKSEEQRKFTTTVLVSDHRKVTGYKLRLLLVNHSLSLYP
ncbi:hypothetical protein MOSE0_A05072 [Monosporozyma servazzii]